MYPSIIPSPQHRSGIGVGLCYITTRVHNALAFPHPPPHFVSFTRAQCMSFVAYRSNAHTCLTSARVFPFTTTRSLPWIPHDSHYCNNIRRKTLQASSEESQPVAVNDSMNVHPPPSPSGHCKNMPSWRMARIWRTTPTRVPAEKFVPVSLCTYKTQHTMCTLQSTWCVSLVLGLSLYLSRFGRS